MIPASSFTGKRCAVFGLGLTGQSAWRSLEEGGAEVLAWDDAESSRKGLSVVDLEKAGWNGIDALVLSPGVPLTHPEPHWVVKRAKEAGVEIIGDTEILVREIKNSGAKLVAITGTNGKSTTTALLGHLLEQAGCNVQVGGNIGTFAVLDLDPPRDDTVYIVEFSSYQIDLTPSLAPDIGILLNISPDHIDRHGSMENYAAIKARVVTNAKQAIIGIDDDYCRQIAASLTHPIEISCDKAPDEGVGSMRGLHNVQNVAAAVAVAKTLGIDSRTIAKALNSFPGLVHRMEDVGIRRNVLFVNDSKGTNAEAASKALGSFDNIFWIAGGRSKEGGIEELREFFPRIAKAYLIGEAAEDFAVTLDAQVDYEMCGDLETALNAAAEDAGKAGREAVVLLSPACASFDQFRSFEVRGDLFRDLVAGLEDIKLVREAA